MTAPQTIFWALFLRSSKQTGEGPFAKTEYMRPRQHIAPKLAF